MKDNVPETLAMLDKKVGCLFLLMVPITILVLVNVALAIVALVN